MSHASFTILLAFDKATVMWALSQPSSGDRLGIYVLPVVKGHIDETVPRWEEKCSSAAECPHLPTRR